MASLFVSYFGAVSNGIAAEPLGSETITTSGTSAQSTGAKGIAAFVVGDVAHWATIGSNPTATATNGFYVPTTGMWIKLPLGHKIGAITA